MATVLRFLSYRVVIYSNDHRPRHVHVMNDEHEAIFELNCPDGPPTLRENYGFRKATLNLDCIASAGQPGRPMHTVETDPW